ncbi:MAG: hypothetical protein U5R48_03575 [Gammaproteobacteria bacterium]|nr:hypothetical protein [Gammaproteobacteria bacterium]
MSGDGTDWLMLGGELGWSHCVSPASSPCARSSPCTWSITSRPSPIACGCLRTACWWWSVSAS